MGDGLGGKLGTRIAEIQRRARLSTADEMTPIIVKHVMSAQEEFFRLTGSEVRDTIGPFWRKIAEAKDVPDYVRDMGNFVANGKGQFATLLAGTATSSIIGAGLGTVFSNWLQPAIGGLLAADPNTPLSIADAAAANVRGLRFGDDMYSEASHWGLSRDRWQVIQALASLTLDAPTIMLLLNRELIDSNTAAQMLKRAGWDGNHSDHFFRLRHSVLSIQDAAAMWNRDILDDDQVRAIARYNGYTNEDADRFNLLGGEPPDLQTLILAWRRGVITESDVDRGIVQGPLRKEWIPAIKELQWVPLDPIEAANAVNQGHMTLATATQHAIESGVRPEDFAVIIDNAGIPPGPQEALSWVNRGSITADQFRSIFAESRIKNKYIDLYLNNRTTLLTMAEIRSLFGKGAMTQDQAVTRLMQRGYTGEDAGIILAGASVEKTTKARDLTVAQVVRLFTDRLISEDAAKQMITAAGYDDQEAQWYIDLANIERVVRFLNTAVSKVHSLYVARRLDDGGASAALDQLQIPTDARDDLLALWVIERGISTKELTTAEVIAATKVNVFTTGQAWDQLQAQGYHGDDALVKLKIAKLLTPDATQEDLVWPNR